MLRLPISIVLTLILTLFAGGGATVAAEDVAIAAGGRGDANYALGRGICRLLNRSGGEFTCSLLPAPKGDAPESYSNLFNVQNGAADFGLAGSDWQHYAVTGTGPVKYIDEKLGQLRSVFSLHSEPVTLVARKDAGINSLDDLKGKRINLGRPTSKTRNSADLVLKAKDWSKGDFVLAEELTGKDQSLAFCHDRVQAIFVVDAHPNEAVEQVTKLCDGVLIDLSDGKIDALLKSTPYLAKTRIAAGTYPGMSKPATTIGSTVTVVSSADVPDDMVYGFVKAIFDRMGELKKLHPALRDLDPADMTRAGLTAPLHPGAKRFYMEQGLM